jgi:hypothetical protein
LSFHKYVVVSHPVRRYASGEHGGAGSKPAGRNWEVVGNATASEGTTKTRGDQDDDVDDDDGGGAGGGVGGGGGVASPTFAVAKLARETVV